MVLQAMTYQSYAAHYRPPERKRESQISRSACSTSVRLESNAVATRETSLGLPELSRTRDLGLYFGGRVLQCLHKIIMLRCIVQRVRS